MIENLVQKYGKQIINELISIMVIKGDFKGVDLKPLLVQHKVITRATKHIIPHHRHYPQQGRKSDGTWGSLDDFINSLDIRNGSGKTVLYFTFLDSELPKIMEELND